MITVHAKPGSLQKAFDALPAGGEPILVQLEAGEYREKCTLSRANVTLCGAAAARRASSGTTARSPSLRTA